jgi:hypothetical protein
MGGMAALVALGATLIAGAIFVATGGAVAARVLQGLTRGSIDSPTFKPLWRVTSVAFFAGLLLGNVLQWLVGGPSPITTLIGLPLYLLIFSMMLRRRFPQCYGARRWWVAPTHALIATGVSGVAIIGLLLTARTFTG